MKTRTTKTPKPRAHQAATTHSPTVTLADVEAWLAQQSKEHLVALLLEQVKTDDRLREAQDGGCLNDLWPALAAAREQEHPADALPIYQRQIEPLANQKNNPAYEQATKYVGKMRELLTRLGRAAEFDLYLAGLRKAHKPKRNFMALLDRLNVD